MEKTYILVRQSVGGQHRISRVVAATQWTFSPSPSPQIVAMYDWHNFDVVFQSKTDYSYDEKTINTILKHRKEFAGSLYFDRVLSNLGLRDRKSVNI